MTETIQMIILAGIVLLVTCALTPKYSVKNKRDIGVGFASPIYADEKGTKLLTAPKFQLQGKPDYIFETWLLKRYIPLEIKSGNLKENEPHLGDVYQLVTYFLIIEELYGKRPPYGKLVYANKTFKIKNTIKLRKALKHTLEEMRSMLNGNFLPQAEPSFTKCRHCICKLTVCEFNKGEY